MEGSRAPEMDATSATTPVGATAAATSSAVDLPPADLLAPSAALSPVPLMSAMGLPSTTPSKSIEPSRFHYFYGEKHWLLIKEGIHIMLDRILIKDAAHLIAKCPLYGRLARVEKRALVLKFATALVQRQPIARNVLVDTIFLCAHEACEIEAKLEAPSATGEKKGKSRIPFMQKVIGEAYHEYYKIIKGTDVKCPEVASLLTQDAPASVVIDIMQRLKAYALSATVSNYFATLAEVGLGRTPAVIFNQDIANVFGVDYFLPPIPSFTAEDERNLVDCIRRDEEDAGKETVFAANLKKALKMIRQTRHRGAEGTEDEYCADATALPLPICSAERVDSLSPALDVASKWAKFVKETDPPQAVTLSATASTVIPAANIPSCASVTRLIDVKREGKTKASSKGRKAPEAQYCDWWRDLRWINKFAKANLTSVLAEFFNADRGLLHAWSSNKDIPDSDKLRLFSLNAEETCKVIDHQPLWLSLRGMVGSNLYADGMWPITSNDGHLSIIKFRRNDKERFWFIDKGTVEASVLAGIFLGWLRTMRGTLRQELSELGVALAAGNSDEVSRGIQRHLEAGILSFMVLKVVAFAIESEAAKAADKLGQLLVEEEEHEAQSKSKRKKKKKPSASTVTTEASTSTPTAAAVESSAAIEEVQELREPSATKAPTLEVLEVQPGTITLAEGGGAAAVGEDDGEWEEVVVRPRKTANSGPRYASARDRSKERVGLSAAKVPYHPSDSAPRRGAYRTAASAERSEVAPPLPSSPAPVARSAAAPPGTTATQVQKTTSTTATSVFPPPLLPAERPPAASDAPVVRETSSVPVLRPALPLVEPMLQAAIASKASPVLAPVAAATSDPAATLEYPALGLIHDLLGSGLDSSPPRQPSSTRNAAANAPSTAAWDLHAQSVGVPSLPMPDVAAWSLESNLGLPTSHIWSGSLGLLPKTENLSSTSSTPSVNGGSGSSVPVPLHAYTSGLSASSAPFIPLSQADHFGSLHSPSSLHGAPLHASPMAPLHYPGLDIDRAFGPPTLGQPSPFPVPTQSVAFRQYSDGFVAPPDVKPFGDVPVPFAPSAATPQSAHPATSLDSLVQQTKAWQFL